MEIDERAAKGSERKRTGQALRGSMDAASFFAIEIGK